jgi:hypothetical protein
MGDGVAPERLVDAPGQRQRVVEHNDLVMKEVGVVLVEMKPLLENGPIEKPKSAVDHESQFT